MEFERQTLKSVHGSRESLEMELVTDMSTGKSKIVLHKTISQEFKTKNRKKAEKLAEKLMGGGGRRFYTLEDLANERVGK